MKAINILVIDGQGGGIGKELVYGISKKFKHSVNIIGAGTNEIATENMKIAGANISICGEDNILKYADKIYHFIAPKILGDNTGRSCFDFREVNDINLSYKFQIDETKMFEPDIMLTYYPLKA